MDKERLIQLVLLAYQESLENLKVVDYKGIGIPMTSIENTEMFEQILRDKLDE